MERALAALLLERHEWETSGSSHQVQIPKAAFTAFFGDTGEVNVRLWQPPEAPQPKLADMLLSYYVDSDTYRVNLLIELGDIGHAVLVIEEADDGDAAYDIWWFTGHQADTVLALPYGWSQAKASQYGPGRFWSIIDGAAPRLLP